MIYYRNLIFLSLIISIIYGCTNEQVIYKSAINYFREGNRFFSNRDYQNAIWNYEKAISLDSETSEFHYNLGLSFYEVGSYEESLKSYLKAQKINPNFSNTYYNIALVYNKMEKIKKADEYYGFYQNMLSYKKRQEIEKEEIIKKSKEKIFLEKQKIKSNSLKVENKKKLSQNKLEKNKLNNLTNFNAKVEKNVPKWD